MLRTATLVSVPPEGAPHSRPGAEPALVLVRSADGEGEKAETDGGGERVGGDCSSIR